MTTRTFDDRPAVRERVPLLIGIGGPSGSGKTYSALRLATGIQRVSGGDIYVVDTEARRALHYADTFKFRHVEFSAPFSPEDYLAAIEHCARKGAGVLVVDSMSHEHEGPGGVLEWHERELDRMAGQDYARRNAMTFSAWAKPKAARRHLINAITQLGVNAIFCFRSKEKIRIPKKGEKDREVRELGWVPIAGEEFVFEMTMQVLLYPGSRGVPNWDPELPGERAMTKLPSQFEAMFRGQQLPLSEDIGAALATWAAGTEAAEPSTASVLAEIARAESRDVVNAIVKANTRKPWTPEQRAEIRAAIDARREELAAKPGGLCTHPDGFAATAESEARVCIHCGVTEDDEKQERVL